MSTAEVTLKHGIVYGRLMAALRLGKMPYPQRTPNGRFIWTDEDVSRLQAALATDRRRKEYRKLVGR